MIEVERKALFNAAPPAVIGALVSLENLHRLMPRVERVEVNGRTENRARLAIFVHAGKFGAQRIDGEVRTLPDGLRFVAVQPVQMDARWIVRQHGPGSEVTAYFAADPGDLLGSLGRFVPTRLVQQRIAYELDGALDALAEIVFTKQP